MLHRIASPRPMPSSRRTTCAASSPTSSTPISPIPDRPRARRAISSRSRSRSGATCASPATSLSGALIDGIRDQGADVIDLGLVSTDALYFAVGKYGYHAGVMITASHNPAGVQRVQDLPRRRRAHSRWRTGIGQIRDLVSPATSPTARRPARRSAARRKCSTPTSSMRSALDRRRRDQAAQDRGRRRQRHGRARPCRCVFEHLPCELVPLYFELDGTFPNHPANPIEPGEHRRSAEAPSTEQAATSASRSTATPTACSWSTRTAG